MMSQDEQRYERWRQMWLSGGNSQAITAAAQCTRRVLNENPDRPILSPSLPFF